MDLPFRIEMVPVGSLRPMPGNPRRMPYHQAVALRKSVKRWGMVDPIIARAPDLLVIGGHQRLYAARESGIESVPCVLVEVSDADAKAMNLALNRISGEWEETELSTMLAELEHEHFDLTVTGFEQAEVEGLLSSIEREVQSVTAPDETRQIKARYQIVINCTDEAEQLELIERFSSEGIACKAQVL